MARKRLKKPDREKMQEALAKIRRIKAEEMQGYRGQALKILPHICGRCGREFSGKELSELTVHHRDGNHTNNPVDGSNWELLCRNCHDEQHDTRLIDGYGEDGGLAYQDEDSGSGFRPFENLKEMLKPGEEK